MRTPNGERFDKLSDRQKILFPAKAEDKAEGGEDVVDTGRAAMLRRRYPKLYEDAEMGRFLTPEEIAEKDEVWR